eukprot:TRINITY_DN12659_c2_g2_i7.p1 TRINITY_DN12659_c2_g2~~TRINITY_DN12659_c2_g2_i7.p1  ORF type:complete len:1372 (+),score=297.18 TRINITY_DN12659_c2_g2_i7:107-4222(+)
MSENANGSIAAPTTTTAPSTSSHNGPLDAANVSTSSSQSQTQQHPNFPVRPQSQTVATAAAAANMAASATTVAQIAQPSQVTTVPKQQRPWQPKAPITKGFAAFVSRTADLINTQNKKGKQVSWLELGVDILRQVETNWRSAITEQHRTVFEGCGSDSALLQFVQAYNIPPSKVRNTTTTPAMATAIAQQLPNATAHSPSTSTPTSNATNTASLTTSTPAPPSNPAGPVSLTAQLQNKLSARNTSNRTPRSNSSSSSLPPKPITTSMFPSSLPPSQHPSAAQQRGSHAPMLPTGQPGILPTGQPTIPANATSAPAPSWGNTWAGGLMQYNAAAGNAYSNYMLPYMMPTWPNTYPGMMSTAPSAPQQHSIKTDLGGPRTKSKKQASARALERLTQLSLDPTEECVMTRLTDRRFRYAIMTRQSIHQHISPRCNVDKLHKSFAPYRRKDVSGTTSSKVEIIRCRCESNVEVGTMVRCEGCRAWQHCACMNLKEAPTEEMCYRCELCWPRALPKNIVLSSEDLGPRRREQRQYRVFHQGSSRALKVGSYMYCNSSSLKANDGQLGLRQANTDSIHVVRVEHIARHSSKVEVTVVRFIRPTQLPNSDEISFYKQEVYELKEPYTVKPQSLYGKCAVMGESAWIKGTAFELPEENVFVCTYDFCRDPRNPHSARRLRSTTDIHLTRYPAYYLYVKLQQARVAYRRTLAHHRVYHARTAKTLSSQGPGSMTTEVLGKVGDAALGVMIRFKGKQYRGLLVAEDPRAPYIRSARQSATRDSVASTAPADGPPRKDAELMRPESSIDEQGDGLTDGSSAPQPPKAPPAAASDVPLKTEPHVNDSDRRTVRSAEGESATDTKLDGDSDIKPGADIDVDNEATEDGEAKMAKRGDDSESQPMDVQTDETKAATIVADTADQLDKQASTTGKDPLVSTQPLGKESENSTAALPSGDACTTTTSEKISQSRTANAERTEATTDRPVVGTRTPTTEPASYESSLVGKAHNVTNANTSQEFAPTSKSTNAQPNTTSVVAIANETNSGTVANDATTARPTTATTTQASSKSAKSEQTAEEVVAALPSIGEEEAGLLICTEPHCAHVFRNVDNLVSLLARGSQEALMSTTREVLRCPYRGCKATADNAVAMASHLLQKHNPDKVVVSSRIHDHRAHQARRTVLADGTVVLQAPRRRGRPPKRQNDKERAVPPVKRSKHGVGSVEPLETERFSQHVDDGEDDVVAVEEEAHPTESEADLDLEQSASMMMQPDPTASEIDDLMHEPEMVAPAPVKRDPIDLSEDYVAAGKDQDVTVEVEHVDDAVIVLSDDPWLLVDRGPYTRPSTPPPPMRTPTPQPPPSPTPTPTRRSSSRRKRQPPNANASTANANK